jgi:8-oxo-dGTP pyrophosphatase MutT (NUDIX family)
MNTIHKNTVKYSNRYQQHHHKYFTAPSQCTNCGENGHILRSCPSPITSYGIIAIRRSQQLQENLDQKLCSMQPFISSGIYTPSGYEYLLIQRKDSLSFVEFIRGKYSINNMPYVIQLFQGMTKLEHQRILMTNFEDLWQSVWGSGSITHKMDYENSKLRYTELAGEDGRGIHRIIAENPSVWDEPEWGFPKGRRNPRESDIRCALREFEEETNIPRSQIQIIANVQPLTETFLGSNHVHYCHKYYLGMCNSNTIAELNISNPHMFREIGAICWLPLDLALQKIRPDNVEKREILLKTGSILRNYCPIPHTVARNTYIRMDD